MRKKRFFTPEFKKEAVALVKQPGMNVRKVAEDLDLTPSALRKWVKLSEVFDSDVCTPSSEMDNEQLRKQLAQQQKQIRLLTMERDILKKAATFFAKESE